MSPLGGISATWSPPTAAFRASATRALARAWPALLVPAGCGWSGGDSFCLLAAFVLALVLVLKRHHDRAAEIIRLAESRRLATVTRAEAEAAQLPVERTWVIADEAEIPTQELRKRWSGESIFTAGSLGREAYEVMSGTVGITDKATGEIIAKIEKGGFFGELALWGLPFRTANAVAVSPVELRVISREDYVDYLKRRPEVLEKEMRLVYDRLRRLTESFAKRESMAKLLPQQDPSHRLQTVRLFTADVVRQFGDDRIYAAFQVLNMADAALSGAGFYAGLCGVCVSDLRNAPHTLEMHHDALKFNAFTPALDGVSAAAMRLQAGGADMLLLVGCALPAPSAKTIAEWSLRMLHQEGVVYYLGEEQHPVLRELAAGGLLKVSLGAGLQAWLKPATADEAKGLSRIILALRRLLRLPSASPTNRNPNPSRSRQ